MKHNYVIILLSFVFVAALSLTTASAKNVQVPKMYMFGFAASFNDSIVHFTDVHEVDSVWIDSKTKFLLGRQFYSYQLRTYLADHKQMPKRTCVVYFAKTKAKAEKAFVKLRKLYGKGKDGIQHYDARFLDNGEFRFTAVDMHDYGQETIDDGSASASNTKKGKKSKKNKNGNKAVKH